MTENHKTTRRCIYSAVTVVILASLLLYSSCYAPLTEHPRPAAIDLHIQSRAPGDTNSVLAGIIVLSEFEERLKDITQMMAAVGNNNIDTSDIEDELEEELIDIALGGTLKFSGNPYFAVEVPVSGNEAEFNVPGIPSNRSYFLYMGSFGTIDEVKQFFGLMEEAEDFDEDAIPYSNVFYVEGEESSDNTITVPFDVAGFDDVPGFEINDSDDVYSGPGWYFLSDWDFSGGSSVGAQADIIAPAQQPFTVETGKSASIEVHLVQN